MSSQYYISFYLFVTLTVLEIKLGGKAQTYKQRTVIDVKLILLIERDQIEAQKASKVSPIRQNILYVYTSGIQPSSGRLSALA